jgi:general secretion pathway protein I
MNPHSSDIRPPAPASESRMARRPTVRIQLSAFSPQLSRQAFTLVEVLISLGIFAVAAVVLGSAYVNILVNYQSMRAWSADREELAFARATLLAEPDRTKAEHGGEIRLLDGGNLHWKATIDEMPRTDLFRVTLDLEVAPPPPVPARREQEVFVLLRPTWSKPADREKLRAAFRDRLAKREF